MFSLICAWISSWVNDGEAGDLGRHRAHYDVTVIYEILFNSSGTYVITCVILKLIIQIYRGQRQVITPHSIWGMQLLVPALGIRIWHNTSEMLYLAVKILGFPSVNSSSGEPRWYPSSPHGPWCNQKKFLKSAKPAKRERDILFFLYKAKNSRRNIWQLKAFSDTDVNLLCIYVCFHLWKTHPLITACVARNSVWKLLPILKSVSSMEDVEINIGADALSDKYPSTLSTVLCLDWIAARSNWNRIFTICNQGNIVHNFAVSMFIIYHFIKTISPTLRIFTLSRTIWLCHCQHSVIALSRISESNGTDALFHDSLAWCMVITLLHSNWNNNDHSKSGKSVMLCSIL